MPVLPYLWRWLGRRFRLPAELRRRGPPRPDEPFRSTTEPVPRGCQPRGARRVVADDDASANGGGRRARNVPAPPFPSKNSRPGAQSHRLMALSSLFWRFLYGSEAVSGSSSEESDEEIQEEEECLFSDYSERAIYQEYLQSIGREYGEEDIPEGVMSVSLFKHQGLGKTIVVIALILKDIDQHSKLMSADSDRAAVVLCKMDEPVKNLGATTSFSEVFHQEAAHRSANVMMLVEDRNPSSPSTMRSWGKRRKPVGGTLVVCPTSILTQWEEEIHKVAKDFGLSVFVYHGCSRNVDPEELAKHDVVLTSYGMVRQQFPSIKKGTARKRSDAVDLNSGPVAWVKWFRIVLDEAHVIRNLTSQVARACWKLEAERRWCITGTPIQNSIDDLYSYLRFLKYEPYSKYSSFCSLLKKNDSINASLGRNKLQIFLGIVLLRRTKETLINGEPIIKLLPKTVQTREVFFTPAEHEFYLTLHGNCQKMWMVYLATRKLRRKIEVMDSIEILSPLKNLQRACNHPCLVKSQDHHQQCSTIFERSYVSSKIKATIDILNSIVNKDAITERGNTTDSNSSDSAPEKVLVFSQFTAMLDLLEPLLNNSHMQFRRLDGKMTRQARDEAVKDFSMNPKVTVLLVSLMAGNVGLNLTAASHVTIVDPWWNPFVEDQAIGRAHRIGQTRPVTVHRLAVQGTIEERVLYLQEKKRRMVERAFGGDIFGDHAKLTEEDLSYLFNV